MSKTYNSLIKEKSPYLLQHSTNPVNWEKWSEKISVAPIFSQK